MPSLLIHNARLLSFQEGFKKGNDCLILENGIIKAIGNMDMLQSFADSGIPMLNAEGKTVIPGFNDSHIHIWKAGNLKTFMLDLRPAKSLDHMLSMLSDYNNRFPEARWITARGFNEAVWDNGKFPTKSDLDKVSKIKPVYIIHTSAHSAVANSKALELASIDMHTRIPDGGEMQIGEDGHPNGVFSETALGLITSHLPAYSKEELKIMVSAAREEMYRYGITAATDPAVDPLLLEAYQEMNNDNTLGFRLNVIPILLPDGSEHPYPVPDYFDSPFLKLNAVKFFSDGGLSNRTAALKRAYKNSNDHGILRLKKDSYLGLCRASMEKGLGIATHAIGDLAIDFVIDVYKELHHSFPGLIKRIEHLGLPDTSNLEAMAEYQIAASMQSVFIYELGRNFIKYLDADYLNQCYPVKSVLRRGILTALSSDAPVVQDFNPLRGLEAAVTRKDRDGNTIAAGEAISIEEGLTAYTSHAARISGRVDFGILEEGKLADIIILNLNPLNAAPDQLTKIRVEKTFIGGELVWQAGSDGILTL
jgi:predicted amidohydrolase YtcJ